MMFSSAICIYIYIIYTYIFQFKYIRPSTTVQPINSVSISNSVPFGKQFGTLNWLKNSLIYPSLKKYGPWSHILPPSRPIAMIEPPYRVDTHHAAPMSSTASSNRWEASEGRTQKHTRIHQHQMKICKMKKHIDCPGNPKGFHRWG